jgi:nitrate reductase gamma subunit
MRRSNLIVLLVALVDVLLLGLAAYLVIGIQNGDIQTAIEGEKAIERVATVLGGAAGVFTLIAMLGFILFRSQKD